MTVASSEEPHLAPEADLLAQNRLLNALHQTSLALLERRQLPELLQMVVQQAVEGLGAAKGFIFRVDEADPQVMRFEVGFNVSPALVGQHIRLGEGLVGRVWERGCPLQVEDCLSWPERLRIDSDSRAMVGVPLRWRSQVVGVLGLAHTQLGRHFSQLEIQGLEQFAQLVTLALDNAQRELQERRLAEIALVEEQQRLISTLASIGDGIIATDCAGRITLVNPAAERLTGWSAAEALGSPLSQVLCLVDEASRQPHPDLVQAVLRQGEVLGLAAATVLIDKAGTERFLSASAAPITDTIGQISGVVVTFRDITRHRHTELALRQSIEREHLLASVALRIHRSFDLDQILATATTEVRQLLQADRVLIYKFQPNGEAWAIEESVGSNWPKALGRVIHPTWFGDLLQDYQQGKVRTVDNLQQVCELTPALQQYLQECQVCAQLVIPLFPSQELWGILVAHQCAQPRQWQPEEITLMEQLATQVEIALQQASLYQQVRDLNEQLERKVRVRTTQLNKQLNALKLQEQLLDAVETAVVVTDRLGRITYWNRFASTLYGLAEEAVLGELITDDGIPFQPEQAVAVLQAIRQGEKWSGEVELEPVVVSTPSEADLVGWKSPEDTDSIPFEPETEDQGSPRTILIEHTPLWDEMGQLQGSIGIGTDITQRKQAEQELKQRMQDLQQLNRLKDDFLSTISHELRTPMANMKMSIHLLHLALEDLQVSSPAQWAKAQRYLGILQQECNRETELINDLLDLQRMESGVQNLQWEWIPLRQWLPSALKSFELRAQQRQQTLTLTLDPTLDQICTDRSSLGRILAELLNNACKYSPPSAEIRVQVFPTASPLGSDPSLDALGISFAITNTGVEIPADQQERIFDKFYRIPAGDPWRQGGTGLGLALIRQMVLQLHGSIQVSSGSNQTCFCVELPVDGRPRS